MKPTTFSPCSATMPMQFRWRKQRRKSSSVHEYSKLSCSVCRTSGMSLRIIQRMWTRSVSFFVRPVLMTDSFPKHGARSPPVGPPRLRSRSCDCGQIRRDEVLGLKEPWPSLFHTASDISNGLSPAQGQAGKAFPNRANLLAPRAIKGESFPHRPAILAAINGSTGFAGASMRPGAYRLSDHLAKEIFPKVKNSPPIDVNPSSHILDTSEISKTWEFFLVFVHSRAFLLVNRRPQLIGSHLHLETHIPGFVADHLDSVKGVRLGCQRGQLLKNHLLPLKPMRRRSRGVSRCHAGWNGGDDLQVGSRTRSLVDHPNLVGGFGADFDRVFQINHFQQQGRHAFQMDGDARLGFQPTVGLSDGLIDRITRSF